MLGGLGVLHSADVNDSKRFIARWYQEDTDSLSLAMDVGAGIGRVSENVLLHFFKSVSVLESDERFIEQAKDRLNNRLLAAHHMRLQCYKSCEDTNKYNLIWIQWVLMYASDGMLLCGLIDG